MAHDPAARPFISVVIPVHNAEEWLPETFTSVVGQTDSKHSLEVIVVDDGSTDASQEIAEQVLAASCLSYRTISISNGGPSRARNIGWQHVSGEWIQFLDADDLLHPNKVMVQATCAIDLADDVAVLYSPWQRLSFQQGDWMPSGEIVRPFIGGEALFDLLATENFLQIGSVLIRRSWLERVGGFDERHWLIEDVDLLLRIAMAGGRFHYMPSEKPLFFYRQRPGESLSQQDQRAFVEGCLRNVRLVEEHFRQQGTLTQERRRALARFYFHGTRYFGGTDQQEFEKLVEKLEELEPSFVPPNPKPLRLLSRLLGYRRAEQVAVVYRRAKQFLHKVRMVSILTG